MNLAGLERILVSPRAYGRKDSEHRRFLALSPSSKMTKMRSLLYSDLVLAIASADVSCKGLKTKVKARANYDSVACRPKNQSAARVKVSLDDAAVCGGTAAKPTPLGLFKAFDRLSRKRSNTYGFHIGNGTNRPSKRTVAPNFFALVPAGTPIFIARTQPEDKTIGKNSPRLTDYMDPDPPASYLFSSKYFDDLAPKGALFAN